MKKIFILFVSFFYILQSYSQCEVSASASSTTITCGQSVTLTAFGQSSGAVILNENFNSGGFGPGWGSTPGATSFSNPCSPGGVDGTPHAWMDNNTSVPRTLTSQSYNLISATAGVTVCFDLLFATQGDAAPCEGPDEPDEGVYLQYSTNGGTTWTDIYYFDPNGGNDPQLTNWNNWCFALPPGAITANTIIRWHQIADSGADYDHWGIDNVQIYQNDVNATLVWLHDGYSYGVGNPGGPNPNTVSPTTTTTYTAQLTTGTGTVCTQSVTVTVVPPTFDVNITANPTSICSGSCSNITATALEVISPASTPTFENNEFSVVASGAASVNINVQGLNTTSLTNGSITSICINGFSFSGSSICTSFGGCPCNGGTVSLGQTCNLNSSGFTVTLTAPGGCDIILVPAGIANGNYSNVCFVPVGGTALGPGFQNGGTFNPNQPISGLNGCNPNGVWTLSFNAPGLGIGIGTLTGWSITFDDPAITGPVSFVWSPTSNMTNANTLNPTVCPTSSTTYSLTVSNPTPGCPSYTESIPITVTNCGTCTPPTFTVTPPAAVCAPNTINLTTTISGAGTNIVTFHSTNADANADTNPLASSTVSNSGTYFIRVEDPTDSNCFTVQSVTVTINPLINVSVTPPNATICAGDNVSLTASGATTYTWANATGLNTTTGATVTASPAATTTYTVTGTTGTCSSTATTTVTISPNLTIAVAPVNPTICAGTSVSLTASGATNYTWTNATGLNTTTGAAVTASPAATTTYTVTGTSGTCSGTTTVTVTVSPNLVISVTPPNATICAGDNISLTASGATTYTWANAAGLNTTSGATVTASPATTTTYTVTGTSGTCTGDTTVTVTVSPNLVISVTPPNATICAGDNVSLTASGATTYTWANAAGLNTTTGATVTASPITTTTYTVTGTTGTCTGDTTVTVTVSPNLVISVTPPNATICAGDNVSLTASGATTYIWANATGLNTTTGATVTASPATTTTYTVTGTSGTCTGDTTVTVTVSPNLVISVTPTNATICAGDNVSLTANGATNYTWANAAGLNTTTGATVTASPITTTTYTVTGTSGTCTGDTTVTVTVSPAIQITNPGDTTICAGDDIQITVSGATNYSWSPSTGLNTSSGSTVIASPSTTTTYTVTASNGVCTSDTTITITVVPQPIVTATANPTTICVGSTSTLTANGASTYTWAPGATLNTTTGTTVIASPITTTQYTLIGANGSCTSSTTVTITVIPVTNANATNNDTICIGESAQLGVSSGNTFLWNPPTGLNNPTIANPVATPLTTTTYTVVVSNNGLCSSSDTVTVVVNPIPTVNAGVDITINNDEILILNGNGQGSLQWTDNGFLLSCYSCPNPTSNPTEDTYYILTTTDANGCSNSDTVNVIVTNFYGLFVPNAITPTSSIGSNDFFMAKGYGIKEFQMMIFNRWGEKIFETNDIYTGWDGTYKGEIVPQDVYVYKIFAIPISGNEIQRIGSVTVVR